MIKLFEEFVTISDYKKWMNDYNKPFYEEMGELFKKFPNHDRNYNRIYFDLKVDPSRFEVKIPDEISDFMSWYGYQIEDYNTGLCRDKNNRLIRIGKLLTKLGEVDLLKTYTDSKQLNLKKVSDLQVVISRHPYDIIGMSTNRGWTTCHDINDKRYQGRHLFGIEMSLSRGSLIAYLIRKHDRNIKNPISRCLISKGSYGLNIDRHIYGTNIPEFREFLAEWVLDK